MANACASHGSRKTGPSASHGMPGTASRARRAAAGSIVMSGGVEIGLERIDRNLHGRVALRAPQLAAVEADRVEPLRAFALPGHDAVRKHVTPVQPLDHADMTAHVARQPR